MIRRLFLLTTMAVLIGCGVTSAKTPPPTQKVLPTATREQGGNSQRQYVASAVPRIITAEEAVRRQLHNEATENMSRGIPTALPDGTILLLRQGAVYGAIILDQQRERPEQVAFTWAYRDDGGSSLDPGDPSVKTGHALSTGSGHEMRFGPFKILWSIAGDGSGYVYYSRLASETPQPNELEIALTTLTALDDIDASASTWLYRTAPPRYHARELWYWD